MWLTVAILIFNMVQRRFGSLKKRRASLLWAVHSLGVFALARILERAGAPDFTAIFAVAAMPVGLVLTRRYSLPFRPRPDGDRPDPDGARGGLRRLLLDPDPDELSETPGKGQESDPESQSPGRGERSDD